MLSCFFFFFFIIVLIDLIPAVIAQIFILIAELAVTAGTQTNEANAEIETQPVNVEDKRSKCSTYFKYLYYSHKKRKYSLEGSLDRALFAAELGFPKILVPRPSQHTSNVSIECARKSEWSKQLYSSHVSSFLQYWYILILLISF